MQLLPRSDITGTNRVNVRDHGAQGNGSSDDTAAIESAWTTVISTESGFWDADGNSYYRLKGPCLYFPAGNYVYTGTGLPLGTPGEPTEFQIMGDGPETTRVTLPANTWLVDSTGPIDKFTIRGLQTKNGGGLFRTTYTGVNVRAQFHIFDCYLIGYTGVGIGSAASDMPYWLIENCTFDGTLASSIGIALNGDQSGCIIRGNHFNRNLYHIKTGKGGRGLRIVENDFLRLAAPSSPVTDVWVVPHTSVTNAGIGFVFAFNKLGSENLSAGDFHILYADEGSGTGFCDKVHSAAASTGHIDGHLILGNEVGGTTAAATTPLIYSTTDDVRNTVVADNNFSGTAPAYLLQLLDGTSAVVDRNVDTNLFANNVSSSGAGRETAAIPVTNVAGYARVIDPAGIHASRTDLPRFHGGSAADPEYVGVLTSALSGYSTASSAITAGIADNEGGATAISVDYASGSGYVFKGFTGTVNVPHWIELDLKQGASNPITAVNVDVVGSSYLPIYFRRLITLSTTWKRYRFLYTPVATSLNLAIRAVSTAYSAGATDIVQIGCARVYVAREPVNVGPIHLGAGTVRHYTGTGSPETVVTATVGSLYTRTDGGALTCLYVKESGSGNTGWIAK